VRHARNIAREVQAIPPVDIHFASLAEKIQNISKGLDFPAASDLLYIALHVELLSASLREASAGDLRQIDQRFRDHLATLALDLYRHS
jgi:hypothetical protein